ncbi:unnamed protein product [Gulo gulo]|uniref:Uncharacterized protein n=1 Tax=Gulo gulo TaxID=48420 RepID=A0A9X9LUE8_GULGU|nr:unnamed protein product [Gulo gulo]
MQAPGPGGDAVPVAVASAGQLLEFTLTVPFWLPMEAEMVSRFLTPHAHHQQGMVQKELTVNGSSLAVRRTAEDAFVPNFHLPHLPSVSPGDMKHSRLWAPISMKAQERELRPNFLSPPRQGTGR